MCVAVWGCGWVGGWVDLVSSLCLSDSRRPLSSSSPSLPLCAGCSAFRSSMLPDSSPPCRCPSAAICLPAGQLQAAAQPALCPTHTPPLFPAWSCKKWAKWALGTPRRSPACQRACCLLPVACWACCGTRARHPQSALRLTHASMASSLSCLSLLPPPGVCGSVPTYRSHFRPLNFLSPLSPSLMRACHSARLHVLHFLARAHSPLDLPSSADAHTPRVGRPPGGVGQPARHRLK